jgi:hypothetical protein
MCSLPKTLQVLFVIFVDGGGCVSKKDVMSCSTVLGGGPHHSFNITNTRTGRLCMYWGFFSNPLIIYVLHFVESYIFLFEFLYLFTVFF